MPRAVGFSKFRPEGETWAGQGERRLYKQEVLLGAILLLTLQASAKMAVRPILDMAVYRTKLGAAHGRSRAS
jgi:hypothetical protein